MPITPSLNPILDTLFKTPATITGNNYITKGNLVLFNYSFWLNDPYPLVIISDYNYGTRIRGVNLHYLTYPVISSLLMVANNNQSFSYSNIKSNAYIVNAFRSYKWAGISRVKKLDCNILLKVMSAVRSIDPSQIKAVRLSIEEQLRRMTNPVLNQQDGIMDQSNNQGALNGG